MRARLLIATLLLAGCGGGGHGPATAPSTAPSVAAASVPKVATESVLAVDDRTPPPLLVIIDAPQPIAADENFADMPVRIASAKSWADVGVLHGAKPSTIDAVAKQAPASDDNPDDGADESGGTGTAMALDEGKMGRKDADRAEGQYDMKRADAPPPTGERGPLPHVTVSPADDVGDPARLADVAGEVMTDGKLRAQHVAILATPRTNARRLARILAELSGELVVAHAGTMRPLRIDFTRQLDDPPSRWIEVRVANQGFMVESVPETPIEVSDVQQLAPAIAKAREMRKLAATAPIDVLVDDSTDAQRLVDLLVALDGAGARMIGIGALPDSDEAKRRGHRNPAVLIGRPVVSGDLDKVKVRQAVLGAKSELLACYTATLAKQPDAHGVVQLQFFITPKGKAVNATGKDSRSSSLAPGIATCVLGIIKTLDYPHAKGRGNVQINMPIVYRR